jgi:hypothetical protein
MARLDSMIVYNPNRDIIEDRRKRISYSLKEISTVFTRIKLIINCLEYLRDIDKNVLYFDHPRYSIFWYFVSYNHCLTLYIVSSIVYLLL